MTGDLERKTTSLALMAIILTCCISGIILGFTLDTFADSDNILNVSAEKTSSSTNMSAEHTDATISIQTPLDEWMSGSAIPITIVDNGANYDSQRDEVFSVSNPDSIIPTLVIGEPFTLIRSNGTTWIGFYVEGGNSEFERLAISKNDPTINDDTRLNLNGTNDDPLRLRGNHTDDRPDLTGFSQDTVTDFIGYRNILTFDDRFDDRTQNSIDALGIVDSGNTYLNAFDFLILDLDNTNLKDVLINNALDDQRGFNMLNYDISSLGENISLDMLQINVARQKIAVIDTDGPNGYVRVPQEFVTDIFASDVTGQLQLVLHISEQDVSADIEYPIFVDFFSFGYIDNNDDGDDSNYDLVANQVVRLELEESTDSQGTFEGTLKYVVADSLNIFDEDIIANIDPTSNNAGFVIVDDLINDSPLQITYRDLSADVSDVLLGDSVVSYIKRVNASNLRTVDSDKMDLDSVPVGKQVQVISDLENSQDDDQPFAYMVQIKNSDGVTVALSWISGLLPSNQSFSPTTSWTPTKTGMYTVTVFVWESVDTPTALSAPVTINVNVN